MPHSTILPNSAFEADLQQKLRRILHGRTMLLIVTMLACFLAWSLFAPLNGGAFASGRVIIDGERMPIQHLEGGVLYKVFVREGEFVEQGQVLAVIKSSILASKRNTVALNLFALHVAEARLTAERNETDAFSVDVEQLAEAMRARAEGILLEERALLQKNRSLYDAQLRAFEAQAEQIEAQLSGVRAQFKSLDERSSSLKADIEGQRTLLEKGLARLPTVRQYERDLAAVHGQREYLVSERARLEAALLQIATSRSEKMEDRDQRIASALSETKLKIAQSVEEFAHLDDAVERSTIKSPISGQVMNVAYDASGSVIPAGGQLMEVVPPNPKLVVEAYVAPRDVESLSSGSRAVLSFPGFSRQEMPRIIGHLASLSDDVIADPNGSTVHYLARIEVPFDDEDVSLALQSVRAGMSVDVTLETRSRTLAEYLVEPLAGAYSKAFISN